MGPLKPSQVRARILREHSVLRWQVDQLAELAVGLAAGDASASARVLVLAQALYRDLHEHIDFEDALLLPALRECDAWGPVRAADLAQHHALQRVQLCELAERSAAASPFALAHLVTDIIVELREDMAHEDRDLLSADLLRDDVVAVDAEAG